jgi:hypothetical protein
VDKTEFVIDTRVKPCGNSLERGNFGVVEENGIRTSSWILEPKSLEDE